MKTAVKDLLTIILIEIQLYNRYQREAYRLSRSLSGVVPSEVIEVIEVIEGIRHCLRWQVLGKMLNIDK